MECIDHQSKDIAVGVLEKRDEDDVGTGNKGLMLDMPLMKPKSAGL